MLVQLFDSIAGLAIAVNPDRVLYISPIISEVSPEPTKNKTRIRFSMPTESSFGLIEVDGGFEEVLAKLNGT